MQKIIIGRQAEQKELSNILQSPRAEFVAVSGRRRVGKTYLIRNFFSHKKCHYFQATGIRKGSLKDQLENFSDAISESFYQKLPMQPARNWREALKRLTDAINTVDKKTKIVLFLDELPWLTTPRSKLLDMLDYYWNNVWSSLNNVKLVICGSSSSWILKKIIYHKGGLHNRVTRRIRLKPFSLNECKQYLINQQCKFTDKQILDIYHCLGGIPYYLNNIKKNLSASQNINNLCFKPDGILFDEFNKLFLSLFNKADAYVEIVRLIAGKHYGLSRLELEKKVKLSQKGGTLSERLEDLEEAGFILSFIPPENKRKGTYYKVIDEYTLFYLTWIEAEHRSLLKVESNNNFWQLKINTPAWYTWSGYAFESVCYKHLDLIRRALNIPDDSRAQGWRFIPAKGKEQNGAQIDLLFDRHDDVISICEIKYSNKPFTINKDYALNLLNKQQVYSSHSKTHKQILISMIASSGLSDNNYAKDLVASSMSLKDLFVE